MATLREEVRVETSAERVWDAARDLGALHTRLVPGFVTGTVLDGDVRVVTFGNGMVVREPIISVDDERRRLAWTTSGGRTTHYNAVLEVIPDAATACRVVWTIDLLPNDMAPSISAMQREGIATLKATLERG